MQVVSGTLPQLVQLDWCTSGFDGIPWFSADPSPTQVRLVANGPIKYVDPVACCMLAAWASSQAAAGRPVIIDDSIKSTYTWRIGLLSAMAGRPRGVETATDRLVQVTNLREMSAVKGFIERVRSLLHLDEDVSNAVIYCLSELVYNVFEHSESPRGAFVSAGYFPQSDRVTLGVVDLGITVPVHLKRHYAPERHDPMDDLVALKLALEPRVSGSEDPKRNAGLGLYMTRRIADLTGGKFWIYSGDVCGRNDGDAGDLGRRAPVAAGRAAKKWAGTAVALTLYPSRLVRFGRVVRIAQSELADGAAVGSPKLFSRKELLAGSALVQIRPDASNVAQDKAAAEAVRETSIMPSLRQGDALSISFSGVALTTQSFVHALLAEPLRLLGREGLAERLRFVACSSQVHEVILIVMGYIWNELEQ